MKNALIKKTSHKSPFSKELLYLEDFKKILNLNANHGLCGSVNLGNTCFMNSSIACLSNCYELTAYFLLEKFIDDINENNIDGTGGELAQYWYELLNYYWNSKNNVGNPKYMKEIVGSKNKKFLGDKQQDSNEFMTLFLEILGEDLNRANKKVYIELKEQQKNETDIDAANRFWNLHIKRNDSIVTDLFHGLLKSTIYCPRCQFKNITYDPFNTLTLTIPNIDEISQFKNNKRKKQLNTKKKEIANIYYVPAFSLMNTIKFEIEIYKDMSLNEIVRQIKERGENIRMSNNLKFISVSNKKFEKFLNPKKTMRDSNYIFGYEKEINGHNGYSVPFYLRIDRKLSAYPRILFFPKKTSFYDFKKKIYFFMRKYIKYPLNDKKSNSELEGEKELSDYINGKYNKLHNVLSLLEEEFDHIHNNKKYPKYYRKSTPYEIIITDSLEKTSEEYIINKGKDNNYDILSRFNIESDNDNVDEMIEYILDNKDINLVVQMNSKSVLIKENISFNNCIVEKIPSLKEENKNEEEEEIEYEDEENHFQNSNNITLDHCLQSFTEEEYLGKGNEWYCNKCRKRVKASKRIELFYLPRIMCICLNRFLKKGRFNDYTKNNTFVDFPLENLNMEKYMCGPDKKFSKYDLFSVSQHYGGMGEGHYTAICKNIDGNWYEYDDKSCVKASESDVCSPAAYVLFYRRKNW